MKLTKVHRVIEFNEKPWMEPYIRLNTELRKKATSDFEKNFFKLINNSVFGKTMENIRKRVDIRLGWISKRKKKKKKLISKPNFKGRQKISDEPSSKWVKQNSH